MLRNTCCDGCALCSYSLETFTGWSCRGAGWGRLMEWVGVKGKEILLGWELGEILRTHQFQLSPEVTFSPSTKPL